MSHMPHSIAFERAVSVGRCTRSHAAGVERSKMLAAAQEGGGGVLVVDGVSSVCCQQTPTLDRGAAAVEGGGGYMGGRCVALTWTSEIDGKPDWPSDHIPAPWPDVWFECSSLSTHCSKVRGSTSFGTGFAHTSTRPSVRGRRRSHPARPGRPRGGRRKVTCAMAFLYVPRAF